MPGVEEPNLQGVDEPCRCLNLNVCNCIKRLNIVLENMHKNYSISMCKAE